jgi:WD40 repeat protein
VLFIEEGRVAESSFLRVLTLTLVGLFMLLRRILLASILYLCFAGCSLNISSTVPIQNNNKLNPSDDASTAREGTHDVRYLFKRSGNSMLAVTLAGGVFLLKAPNKNLEKMQPLVDFGEEPFAVSYDSVHDRVALGFSKRVVILSIKSPESPWVLTGLDGRVSAIAFAPDGNSILMTRLDNRIYRWRFFAEGKQPLHWNRKRFEQYIGHGSVVSSLAFHPFGRVFFSGDWDGGLFVWQVYDADEYGGRYDRNIFYGKFYTNQTPREIRQRKAGDAIEKLSVSKDGLWLMVGYSSGSMELWMVRGLKLVSYLEGHKGGVQAIEFSPDGRFGVSLGRDGKLLKWRIVDKSARNDVSGKIKLDLVLEGEYLGSNTHSVLLKSNSLVIGTKDGEVQEITYSTFTQPDNLNPVVSNLAE